MYNFHYTAKSMIKSQILNILDSTKTQKSRYLEIKTLFFLQMQKFITYTSMAILWQKILL